MCCNFGFQPFREGGGVGKIGNDGPSMPVGRGFQKTPAVGLCLDDPDKFGTASTSVRVRAVPTHRRRRHENALALQSLISSPC